MKSTKTIAPSYALTDFYLTSYLLCKGMELQSAEPQGPTRVVFLLKDLPQRPLLIQEFYAHKAMVDPLVFKDTVVNLKSMLHGLKRTGGEAAARPLV